MKKQKNSLLRIAGTAIVAAAFVIQAFPATMVSAATGTQITNRSLTLVGDPSTPTVGGSLPGGLVKHSFSFTLKNTTDNLGSIMFQYCTTAAEVPDGINCVAPTGISTATANMSNESGAIGFTGIDHGSLDDAVDGVNNTVTLKRGSASKLLGDTPVSYDISGVINPTTRGTFFVRITTYASLDGTGPVLESGTVAAATNYAINLDGTMPESLVFCAGAEISLNTGNVPDCATATLGTVSFDRLFSPTDTAIAQSKMAASTNAGFGYSIAVHGPTLTSGSNTIAPMSDGSGNSTGSIQGTPQFGLNLVENLTTADKPFGAALTQSGGTLYTGAPAANYGTAEKFKYQDADVLATSAGGSDAQIYTVAYMANVPGSQPAGTYSTTLTYICTPKF